MCAAANLPIQIQRRYCKSPGLLAWLSQRLNLPGSLVQVYHRLEEWCALLSYVGIFSLVSYLPDKKYINYWSCLPQSAWWQELMKELDGHCPCPMPDARCQTVGVTAAMGGVEQPPQQITQTTTAFVHDLITHRCKMAWPTCQSGACCNYPKLSSDA